MNSEKVCFWKHMRQKLSARVKQRYDVPEGSWVSCCCPSHLPWGLSVNLVFQTDAQICPWERRSKETKKIISNLLTFTYFWQSSHILHTYLFQIHAPQSGVHALYNSTHGLGDLRDKKYHWHKRQNNLITKRLSDTICSFVQVCNSFRWHHAA